MTAENNDVFEEGSTEMSDAVLVSTAKSGDADAFVELSKRHYRRVFYETYRITRNQQDAEDALQDSLLKAFSHLKISRKDRVFPRGSRGSRSIRRS